MREEVDWRGNKIRYQQTGAAPCTSSVHAASLVTWAAQGTEINMGIALQVLQVEMQTIITYLISLEPPR
jgi:hypothetical protein